MPSPSDPLPFLPTAGRDPRPWLARDPVPVPAGGPVPTITPEDIEALVTKPASATGDTGSRTAKTAAEMRALFGLAADLRNRGDNPQGGRRSAWRQIGMGRVIPPGAV